MRRIMLLLSPLLCSGCIGGLMQASRVPDMTTFVVPLAQEPAYQRALTTAVALGTTITLAQAPDLIQGTLNNAVLLSVRLSPEQQGTLVSVSGSIIPNRLILGTMTATQDFQRAYERGMSQ